MLKRDPDHVTIPDPGDLLFPRIPVEAIRAYSVGKLPLQVTLARLRQEAGGPEPEPEDDGLRVRVAEVKVDGQWVPL